jgi:hypothetical protein
MWFVVLTGTVGSLSAADEGLGASIARGARRPHRRLLSVREPTEKRLCVMVPNESD